MTSNSIALDELSNEVMSRLPKFLELGLERVGSPMLTSSEIADTIEYTFSYRGGERTFKLSMSVLKGMDKGVLHGFVCREDGRNLSLSDYVRTHQTEMTENSLIIHPLRASLRTWLPLSLDNIEVLLRSELKPYLDGSAWESIPVDFQSYQ